MYAEIKYPTFYTTNILLLQEAIYITSHFMQFFIVPQMINHNFSISI